MSIGPVGRNQRGAPPLSSGRGDERGIIRRSRIQSKRDASTYREWMMQMTATKILPCLWFDSEAEEAAKFYASIFKNAKIGKISRYGKEGFEVHGRKAGTVMTVEFEIEGQKFVALNGGPHFKFNEAVSFQIHCETQQEIDHFWSKLAEGGKEQPCGWVKDKFGLCWQVIPNALPQMLMDEDSQKAQRVMKSMLQMRKIDIDALKRAQAA
jgi:predicted 3-demethylubiquinone-9 3-methyltransferase (glyoxalase superfamily)